MVACPEADRGVLRQRCEAVYEEGEVAGRQEGRHGVTFPSSAQKRCGEGGEVRVVWRSEAACKGGMWQWCARQSR